MIDYLRQNQQQQGGALSGFGGNGAINAQWLSPATMPAPYMQRRPMSALARQAMFRIPPQYRQQYAGGGAPTVTSLAPWAAGGASLENTGVKGNGVAPSQSDLDSLSIAAPTATPNLSILANIGKAESDQAYKTGGLPNLSILAGNDQQAATNKAMQQKLAGEPARLARQRTAGPAPAMPTFVR